MSYIDRLSNFVSPVLGRKYVDLYVTEHCLPYMLLVTASRFRVWPQQRRGP